MLLDTAKDPLLFSVIHFKHPRQPHTVQVKERHEDANLDSSGPLAQAFTVSVLMGCFLAPNAHLGQVCRREALVGTAN